MNIPSITVVVLAGGQASRMHGQDKGLITFKHQPLICHVLKRLKNQAHTLLINANRHLDDYAEFGDVITDVLTDFQGPLAGMQSGLINSETDWVLFVPCDTPFIPADLMQRLWLGLQSTKALAAFADDGEREHPTHLLMSKQALPHLNDYLTAGQRKIRPFLTEIGAVTVDFSDCPSSFENINTLADRDFWEKQ